MEIILESDRDRRILDWLVGQVGLRAVERACSQLAGERKAYVSNIVKILGLSPPDSILATPRDEALAQLASIKGILKKGRRPR
ncbi:MAG: hypothetical protein EOO81_04270 [Oxalobacteraceae bacterium]|nr:MAG: hypothetical protein EOO81_04270 [Oxalobacteraceae bacterium]